MEILIDIVDTIKKYPLDMVNCYDRPLSIVLNKDNKKIGNFYLMFTMLFKSYYHEIANNSYEQFYFKILDDILKIKFLNKKITDELNKQIIEHLYLGYLVLVPCNLYELYYSKHYKKNNWSHLLIINGYDEDTKLYNILDSEQQTYLNDEVKYYSFKMKKEDLTKIVRANNYFEKEQYIYFFEINYKENSYINLLIKFIEIFIEDLENNKCIQNYLIKKVNENFKFEKIVDLFINANKRKKVAISEFIDLLKFYQYRTDCLEDLNEKIYKIWNKFTLIKLKEINRKKNENIDYLNNQELIYLDKELIRELLLAKKYLIENSYKYSYMIQEDKCLNNEDKIIEFNNDYIKFCFSTNRTYNTWICDNAPKVILMKEIKNSIIISCRIKILYYEDVEGFMSGIYVKLLNNDIYMFGLDYMGNILLQLVGKTDIVSNLSKKNNSCRLQVSYIEKSLNFSILSENKVNTIYIKNDMKIKQVGLFCKTWNKCNKLEMQFDNIEINMIK